MAEQPLSSDHEAASVPSAPAQRAPPEMRRARRWPWAGITIVRLTVLLAAGVIVVLFATQWDRWSGYRSGKSRMTPMFAATSRR